MRRVSILGPHEFRVAEEPTPTIGPDDLLLAPLRVGICATDLELLDGSMVYLQNGMAVLPLTPGHEWVARVVEVGDAVTGFDVGDTVVGECSVGCGVCAVCRSGEYHRCPDRSETGFMGIPGALTERMAYPARGAHRIPDGVPIEDAALIEPTAVSYRALLRLAPAPGSTVLVVGAGTLGYLAVALLRAAFDVDVAVLAGRPESMARVTALGARAPEAGETFPYVLEAAGTVAGLDRSFEALGAGGRLVLIGLTGEARVPIPLDDLVVRDQEVLGSLGSPHVWPAVIELVASGRVRPGALVTRTYDLVDYGAALAHLAERDPATGKVLIAPERVIGPGRD
jgi:threonine dehydrogenase-like Zn-dependent dehydrogenase